MSVNVKINKPMCPYERKSKNRPRNILISHTNSSLIDLVFK